MSTKAEMIRTLINQGMSDKQIQDKLNVYPSQISSAKKGMTSIKPQVVSASKIAPTSSIFFNPVRVCSFTKADFRKMDFDWSGFENNKLQVAKEQTLKAIEFFLPTEKTRLDWNFEWMNRKRTLGYCEVRNGIATIKLSIEYVMLNSTADIQDTILHEVAHAMDFEMNRKMDHGTIWKNICYAIGCCGERLATDIVSAPGKYQYKCPKCDRIANFHKPLKRTKSCGKCCSHFNPNYILVRI